MEKPLQKEIAHSLCQHISHNVHATQGNLNNLIGVPLTLLSANLEEDWWVIEMEPINLEKFQHFLPPYNPILP